MTASTPAAFEARVIRGSQRGRQLGTPTLNLELSDVPHTLQSGIYACLATLEGHRYDAVLFFGPRPVFQDSVACEVHVIDAHIPSPPARAHITLLAPIRDVMTFPDPEALKKKIAEDIATARGILARHRTMP